jgi:type IV pilus assembly protein PilY1
LQCLFPAQQAVAALTNLTDQPLFVTNSVPPNVLFTLSVEYPTGVTAAYQSSTYSESTRYLGYFDPERCYGYYQSSGATRADKPTAPVTTATGRNAAAAALEYFKPVGSGSGTGNHQCSGSSAGFSGNYLNWATMHSLDEFRFAMTGGSRQFESSTVTILEKSRHTGQSGYSNFPRHDISGSVVSTATPLSGTNLYARVVLVPSGGGSSELNPWSDSNTSGRVVQIGTDTTFATNTYTYVVRVAVCDPNAPGGLEYSGANDYQPCTAYNYQTADTNGNSVNSTVYRPTGLIQKNAAHMRFGVTAYQYDATTTHSKGVLRARLKSVGPTLAVPTGTPPPNTGAAEWNADGSLVANPDSGDASASNVPNSGVINYINKFGKTNGYMTYDTAGELFYAALRALRNMPPPANYVSGLGTPGSSFYDGFPIITTVADETDVTKRPIQYACQRNNFVGIADANTHTDTDIPGNALNGYSGHATGGEITDDPAINAKTLDDTIGYLEGFGSGVLGTFSSARSNTFNGAGLAYWANTQDILKDDPTKPWTLGKQTAQTYWLDVREPGDGPVNTWMWMSAKYGGFTDINGDGKPASNATWHTNTDVYTGNSNTKTSSPSSLNGLRPDNWFSGDKPSAMISGLQSIFNSVLSKSLSSSGASLSTINFQTSSTGGAYTVQYNSKDWTGDVLGNTITVDANGNPVVTNMWSAQSKLDTQGQVSTFWDTGRFIATYDPVNKAGIPFRLANLNATQQGYIDPTKYNSANYGTGATAQTLLNYIRGQKTNDGVYYRARTHLLGDIIDSEATAVGPATSTWFLDTYNPGYSAFVTANASRAPMVYVGSNDGMLHAIDGSVSATSTTGGQEKWAYVPNMVLSGPTLPTATPDVDGLQARARLTGFVHKYYVDQTPSVQDVDFSRTSGGTAAANGDWHTILVAGLNKGGRGYYALDVTNPGSVTSETTLSSNVLWEFTDPDMGYSYGRPIIAKTAQYGWVVILSSGYNNVYGSTAANRGLGFLYVLNAKTGALLQKISTGVGSATSPSGFAHPAAFIPVPENYTLDYVYGGDLNGNVWRFDLRAPSGTYPSPTLFAQATDKDGNLEQITVEPKIEIGANGNDRWVFVGTGKMLSSVDLTNTDPNTFFAFRDGSLTQVFGLAANGEQPMPTGFTMPILRSMMIANTKLLKGVYPDLNFPMGWYYDLGTGEKITTTMVANQGLISWTSYLPATDPCSPGASSKTYVTDYDYGVSRLTVNNAAVEYFSSSSYLVKLQFVKDSSGKIRAILTTGDPTTPGGQIQGLEGNFNPGIGVGTRINWREILD